MYLSKKNYFNFLIALIPVSFIAGNLIINIIITLLILSTIFFYNKELLKINFYFLDKIIIFFFLLVLITGFINDYELFYIKKYDWRGFFPIFVKSLLFLRYLLLYICLRYLVEKDIVAIKFFFLSSLLCIIFVSFDLLYQSIIGNDIFGFIASGRKLGGPFGDELIAGGYLQRFSLFALFSIPIFLKSFSQKKLIIISFLLVLIVLLGIVLSGNRFPLILFIFSICFLIFIEKNRKFLFTFLISFFLIFLLFFNLNSSVNKNFKNFSHQINMISTSIIEGDFDRADAPIYLKEFYSFRHTWLLNKYIGGGIKNFRLYCHLRKDSAVHKCNMHPHNYYLEILTETGIVGFFTILIIFSLLTYHSLYKRYLAKKLIKKNILITPFMILFIVEIFPIRSSGSFFTTGTAVYLFLLIGILVGLMRKNETIENVK